MSGAPAPRAEDPRRLRDMSLYEIMQRTSAADKDVLVALLEGRNVRLDQHTRRRLCPDRGFIDTDGDLTNEGRRAAQEIQTDRAAAWEKYL